MKLYETTFILHPDLKEEGWEGAVSKYSGIITQNGTIRNTYRWGLRRLSYEIGKQSHGYYVHIIHESAPSIPRDLERQFLLDETCLRYLTVVADNPLYIEELEKQKVRESSAESGLRSSDTTTEPEEQAGAVATAEAGSESDEESI